jgi:23S rRNA (uracil1939-C5)-methyltransferase
VSDPGRNVATGSRRARPAAAQPVEITEIGAGGAGVGRLPGGRIVFVPGTAPGEEVLVEPVDVRKDWARGRLASVVRASSQRRAAPCRLAGTCGGCALQHVSYATQLEAKAAIVARAFRRIGHIGIEPSAVEPSPLEFAYRNRASFSLRRLGSLRVVAGFHALHDPARVVEVAGECLLPEAAVSAAWLALRREWGPSAHRLPAGSRLRLTLRASVRGEVTLLIDGGFGPGRPDELLARIPGLVAIWHRPRSGAPALLAGKPTMAETWNGEDADIGGAAFLQVNRLAAARLEDWVIERVGPPAGLRVVDAHCGMGLHARRLARLGADVTGIELDGDAIAAARNLAGDSVRFLAGRVEDLLPETLPADVVIVNPPRTGLAPVVTRLLSDRPPGRLLYVSCDPATLARDLDRMRQALKVTAVRCFDLFPQTAHVETVAEVVCATS